MQPLTLAAPQQAKAPGRIVGREANAAPGAPARGFGASGATNGHSVATLPASRLTTGAPLHRPAPAETSRPLSGGGRSYFNSANGTTVNTGANGRVISVERPGIKATGFREDGYAGHIDLLRPDGSKIVVDRGLRGDRRIEMISPGRGRVVSAGREAFVERPLRPGYVSRTYVFVGRTDVRVYRSYTYHSIQYVTYVPAVYYQPAFYVWAGQSSGTRFVYDWGWGPAAPWFFGGYYTPDASYASPALWLTDSVLAADLRSSYDNQRYAGAQQQPADLVSSNSNAVITPEIKTQVAEQIKQQLATEQAAASQASDDQLERTKSGQNSTHPVKRRLPKPPFLRRMPESMCRHPP